MTKQLSRPSGDPPPTQATLPDGTVLDLVPLAAEVTDRYAQAFPDEDERYSAEWRAWSDHDNQHVLWWAINTHDGTVDLWAEISWLARVLEARDFPLDRLVLSLQLVADVLRERAGATADSAAAELRAVAARVASTPTFLVQER